MKNIFTLSFDPALILTSYRKPISDINLFKKLLLPAILSLSLFSCNKTGTPANNNGGNNNTGTPISYISSIWENYPPDEVVDSFVYNNAHNVGIYAQYYYDSSSSSFTSSIVDSFFFNTTDTVPYAYSCTLVDYAGLTTIRHQLYYDINNRIIKDTALDGSDFVTNIQYFSNIISAAVLFEGTWADAETGTWHITNGNVVTESLSISGGTTTGSLGYDTYANPAYYPSLANTTGVLLNLLTINGYGGYQDFISKNFGYTANGYTYLPITDTQGRVIYASIAGIPGSVVFHYKP